MVPLTADPSPRSPVGRGPARLSTCASAGATRREAERAGPARRDATRLSAHAPRSVASNGTKGPQCTRARGRGGGRVAPPRPRPAGPPPLRAGADLALLVLYDGREGPGASESAAVVCLVCARPSAPGPVGPAAPGHAARASAIARSRHPRASRRRPGIRHGPSPAPAAGPRTAGPPSYS